MESDLKASRDEVARMKSSLSESKASSSQDLDKANQTVADLESKVSKLSAERDSAKSSLLELEIARHENEANVGSEREKVKLDLAKVVTEKETLEMTLELRDKELKAKKEEFRKELVFFFNVKFMIYERL